MSRRGSLFSPLKENAACGECRLFPLTVEWKNPPRTAPGVSNQYDAATGKSRQVATWGTRGLVWQAEEAEVDGKWVRWFGFVGPGFFGKAPAAELELELPDGSRWGHFDKGIEWRLGLPEMANTNQPLPLSRIIDRKPLQVVLHVRNVLGIDQPVPSGWFRSDAKAFAADVQLRLQYQPTEVGAREPSAAEKWLDVSPKPSAHLPATSPGAIVGVGLESPTTAFDLRNFFTIEKPGNYCLQLVRLKPAADALERATPAVCYFSIADHPESGHGK